MPHVVVVVGVVVATILLDLASGYRFPFRALLLHTLSGSRSHSLPDTLSFSLSLSQSQSFYRLSLVICFRVFSCFYCQNICSNNESNKSNNNNAKGEPHKICISLLWSFNLFCRRKHLAKAWQNSWPWPISDSTVFGAKLKHSKSVITQMAL